MIFIIEQSTKENNGKIFSWKGSFFKSKWDQGITWRVMWGLWSISYYPAIGLKYFFDYIRENNTEWNTGNKKRKKKPKDIEIKFLWKFLKEQHDFRVEDTLSYSEIDESWSLLCNRIDKKIYK